MLNEHTAAAAMGALNLSDADWEATPAKVREAIVAHVFRGRKATPGAGPRPHASVGIFDLKDLAEQAIGMGHAETLRELLHELSFRNTAKAGQLGERVAAALAKAGG